MNLFGTWLRRLAIVGAFVALASALSAFSTSCTNADLEFAGVIVTRTATPENTPTETPDEGVF